MKSRQLKREFTLLVTAADKCALVEVLKPEYIARANVFVSHAYSYDVRDSIECMLRYNRDHPGSVFWFDPFSLNQHPRPAGIVPTSEMISAFGDRIQEYQATLIVASPWDKPAFLARAWCLFEFMCSHNARKPTTIMLPRKQEEAFVRDLGENWKVTDMLAKVDSRNAEAKMPEDLQAIHQQIEQTVTYHELNKMATTRMREWLVETGLEQEKRLRAKAEEGKQELLDFQQALSIMLDQLGEYEIGERVARECLRTIENARGAQDLATLQVVRILGLLLEARGKLDEASPLLRRALQGREEALGPKHPETLTSVNDLGLWLKLKGDLDEAETFYRRALEGREERLGHEHPDTFQSVNNLGLLLKQKGNLDEAEPFYRRALVGSEKLGGLKHLDTLIAVGNLSLLLFAKGKLDEAETLSRRALEGQQENWGTNHPQTLGSLANLAVILQAQGKLDEAESLYRRALQGREEKLGLNHLRTTNTSGNLGSLLMEKEDSVQQTLGRGMVEKCLKSLKEQHDLPASHPLIVKFEKILLSKTSTTA